MPTSSFGSFGGASSTPQSASRSQSGQYFNQPGLVEQLAQTLAGVQGQAGQNYMNFIQNPAEHPIFQNALSGLLAALAPSETAARTGLADQFRGAGNMSSSIFGGAARGQESDLLRNRQTLASQLLTSLFPQVTQALYQPLGQTSSLIDALKLNQATSESMSQGGGGGGGSQQPTPYYTNTGMGAVRGGLGPIQFGGGGFGQNAFGPQTSIWG